MVERKRGCFLFAFSLYSQVVTVVTAGKVSLEPEGFLDQKVSKHLQEKMEGERADPAYSQDSQLGSPSQVIFRLSERKNVVSMREFRLCARLVVCLNLIRVAHSATRLASIGALANKGIYNL